MYSAQLDIWFLLLPLMAALAGLLAFPYATLPASRHYTLGASLAISLMAGLIALLGNGGDEHYMTASLLRAGFMTVLAQIIASSLLDRSRFVGLVGGSVLAMLVLVHCLIDELPVIMPLLERSAWLLACLIAAALCSLIGSAALAPHPARAARGEKIPLPKLTNARSFGIVLLALTIGCIDWANDETHTIPSFLIPALTAALYPLLGRPNAGRLHASAEGLLAGTVIALMVSVNGPEGVAYGVIAAVLVQRGLLIAHALRLDDPARLVGTILLPAMAGLLLPYLNDLANMATALRWLGVALLAGGVVGMLGWPLVKLSVGLAAPPKRVREGLDFHG